MSHSECAISLSSQIPSIYIFLDSQVSDDSQGDFQVLHVVLYVDGTFIAQDRWISAPSYRFLS